MIRLIAIILALVAANRAATFSRRAMGGCETQADVTFVLDSSDIVGKDNFDKELDFVANSVSQMDTSPGKTRVSIVTYSSGVYNQFFLKSNPIRNEILHIPFRGGRTHTADAIRYVTQTSFNPVHGARNNVPHIAVLVTNSPSSSKQITKIEAQSAKDNNIIMYSVGVGSGVDKDELQAVASDPDSRYLMQAQNYGALGSIAGPLATKICNELPSSSAALPAPTSCLHKADLAFLIDSSTSVGPANFQKMENFLKQSISKLDVGPDKVHVGLMQYSSYPNMEFPLNMYTDRIDALKAVESVHYMSGGTNTADAIKYMREQMFSLNSGARGNVPRIAIVVTDGGSINGASTTYQADQARQTNNIGLIAVGVGNNVNKNELDSIANSPASQNVITVSNYDQLDQIVDQLLAKTCTITPTMQPMVTAAPGGTLPPDTCVDHVNCASYGQKVCTNYGPWANDNCARFCGVCTPLFTTPVACQDSLGTCATYGLSACTQFPEWAKANCQHFCGLCDASASSSGFYGKCSYKGQTYQTGAKWSDACDYDCICEDGNTGRYKCFNKCPLYHGLPKDCTLIKKDGECCLQPVCNFHQTIQKFESTGKGQTASGIKVCVSSGKQYFQGQTWEDGCSKQCVCTNATEGLYSCDAICPSYNNIPANCHLDQKPGDCCQKPICEYDQQHGSFTGIGTVSGQGLGAHPTTPIPCEDRVTTCAQYGKDVCTNYQGWASDNCRKFCGICGGEPTPNSNDKCIYQGQSHGQGQSWSIGCDTQCTCENAAYGYYRCDNTCPKYNNLPAGCYETKHSTDCCTTVRCDSGNFIGSTTDPNSIGSGGLIHVLNPTGSQQVVSPTQPSGATVAPGAGGTGFIAPTLKGCLFKGQLYVQDQTWEDGCSYSCRCTDSAKGVYSCRPKCPMYNNLPSSCHMDTDPNDPCCQAPKCRYDPITGSTFIPIPAFQPAVQYHGLVRPPTVGELYNQMEYTGSVLIFGTNLTPAPPTQRANTTGGIGHCEYRGNLYTQGQTWEDGCDYNCVCEDSRSGLYRCIEKCNHFGNLPQPYCYLKQDPANPCCKIPYCNFPINYVTNTGYISTAKPPSDHCEYKGSQYKQDQSWYDGCDYQCTCDDALSGNYRCLSRCPAYNNVNSSCTMVPDPNDPYCCNIPSCPATNVTGNASTNPTPAPTGYYSGYQGGNIGKCIYKGDSYVQGETWSDGCDYNCECVEAGKGHYTCTDKCAKYPSLPSQCRLISDFTNPCCKRPVCDGQPGSVVTGLNPVIGGTTAAPNPIPTLAPNAQYCVYENAKYIQGQTWEVGCEYRCRCDDASRGVYVCNERCPKYNNLGSECHLVADNTDGCCLAPQCIFPPLTGNATGSFTPDMIPTAAPGVISGSINIPTPAPVPGGSTVAPPILSWCEYKGARYGQDEKWYDGCDYQCECVSASTGKFKCVERCRRYLNLPAQCRLVKDPANPCCKTPECDFQGVTQGITNNPTPQVGPTLGPPGPGSPTLAPNPNSNPTPAPTPTEACVYKGKNYNEGQQWYDGCDYVCFCEDGPAGVYRCSERCAAFPKLPASCKLVSDPKDPFCCEVPECSFTPANGTYTGYGYPTAAPGIISGGSVVKPTPRPNVVPTAQPIPGVSTVAPSPSPSLGPTFKDVCVYKGQQYTQGQKWEDGCDYNCECVDAKTGFYQCSERCSRYVNLPDGCTLQRDYVNPCCMKPYCVLKPTPKPAVTPSLGPGQTPSIQPNSSPNPVCMYNGVPFTQGQSWSDGCELKCVCENATTGYFRCNDRCPHYDLTPGCTMITDPRDSCCVRPYCDPRITPTPGPAIPTAPGVPGQTYTPQPGQTFAPGLYPTLPGGVPLMPGLMLTPAPGETYAPGLYPTLPGGATLVPPMAQTPYPGYTYPAPIPTAPGIPGQTYTPAPGQTYAPGLYPTLPGGITLVPGMMLTPAPGKTYAPGLYPTLPGGGTLVPPMANTPYPFFTPAPIPTAPGVPGQMYTPAPGKTYAPNLYPTIPGGQPLVPGMILTPLPGQTYAPGLYPTLPGGATLVPQLANTPAPAYTSAPIPTAPGIPGQTYTPSPGKTYAPYLYPTVPGGETLMPGMMLTPAPGQVYIPGYYPTLPGGATLVPNLANTPPTLSTPAPKIPTAPGIIGQTYTPSPGQTYAPGLYPTVPGGQTLVPGMMLTPQPGKTYAPGLYPTLPGGQTLIPPMMYTPYPGFTYAPPIPTAPGIPGQTYTPSPGLTYAPNLYPTIPGGQPLVPGMMLTPQPGKTYAPNLYPTLPGGNTLVPPFAGYTFAPIPTAPGVPGQIYTPSPGKTYAPGLYPTVPGGQTLVPGMMLTPRPGLTYAPGLYPTLPGGATLVPPMINTPYPGYTNPAPVPTAPGIPGQTYTPAPGQTYAPGLYPTIPGGETLVPGMMLTPEPGRTYAPGLYPTLPGGATLVPPMINSPYPVYTYPAPVPTAPGIPGQTYTPSPGQTYAPGLYPTVPGGQTLVPGMMLTPQPGKTYAPGLYPTLPGGGTLIPPLMYTPFPGYTYPAPIPTAPGIPGQTYTPAPGKTYAPNLYPTVPGGQPLVPGMMLTPSPGKTYSPLLYPTLPGGNTLVPPFAGYTFAPIPTAPGVPGQIYTPSPGKTYAPGLYPTVPGGQTLVPGMMLTPEPGKTYGPSLYPTLPGGGTLIPPLVNTPYPGFTYPTPIPTAPGIPGQTYTPSPGQTYAPNLYPTIPGGQPLVPGMMLTPQPGKTYAPGLYPTLPGGVTLVPQLANTPRPGYTFAPVPTAPGIIGQTYTPSPGKTYRPDLYPTVPGGETLMPGMMLTPTPGQVYVPGLYPTLPGGITLVPPMVYTPYPGYTSKPPIPTAPGIPGQTYTPSPGHTYAPGLYPTVPGGQTLVPGMMLTPQPGKTYAPGLYPTLPGGQTLIPPLAYTPYPGFTYAPPIPTAPGIPGQTYTPSPGLTYAPNLYPTIPGGQPLVPGMILTPLPGLTYAPNLYPTLPGGKTLVPPFAGYTFAPIPTAPGVPGQIYTPSPGKTYAPGLYPTVPGGQTLVPGMMLTPQPGKTYAPGLYPTLPGGGTLIPPLAYTPYPGYTFSPPIPTAPGVPGQTYTPSPGQTYAPGLYPTVPGGQTLVPGMMLTPQPGRTYAPGLYPTLPGGATLIPPLKTTAIPTAPGVPGQTYTPLPGQTYAPGLYPTLPGGVTLVPGMMLTPQPGKTYAPNLLPTLPGGVTLMPPLAYTPYPGFTFVPPIPTAPGIPGQTYTPSPGKTYAPGLYPTVPGGQTLVPGMMLTPQPGKTYAPGLYPTLPSGGTLVPPYAPTPYPGFTYSVPIPTAPGIPGQTYTPSPGKTYAPYLYPTVPGGETLMPGMMLTPQPGVMYQPGLYPTLPGGGTLVPSLASTPYPKYTYAPPIPTAPGIIGQTYTPSPGQTYAPGLYPTVPGGQTLVPGMMLTPQPGKTYAPGLYPTLPGGGTLIPPLMYTPFPGYTYPAPIPTAPGIPGQIYTPAPGKTYAPNLYPTVPGGQPLVPGMILTPMPGRTYAPGLYPTLPSGETLVPPFAGYTFAPIPTAPGVPGQIYTPSPGKTYAPYLYPTVPGGIPLVPGMMLTPQPGKTYAPGLYPTLPGGSTLVPPMVNTPYPGFTYPAPIPTAPGIPGQLYTPAPGKTYAPSLYPTLPGGIPLVPGMMLTPQPGKTFAPGLYPTLPGGVTLVPQLANTPYPGYTFAPLPTAPGIPGQTYTPSPGKTYAPYLYPTVPGGETLMPGMILTPQPGVMYQPGMYPTLPGGVTLVPTPYHVPVYTPPTPAVTPSPYPVPTAVPGIFEGKGVNGQGKVCMYEGVAYQQGEKWQDGCAYDCECIDDSIGRYRCKEKCPLFLNVPSYCRLVVDPNEACCKIPQCVEPTLRPTPAPHLAPGVSPTPHTGPQTVAPTLTETCVFNGKSYTQGQQWYDGCDRTCVCEDAHMGYYRCDDRCPKFPNLPTTCTLTADPKDPECCKVPQCIPIPGVNGNTVNPSAQPVIVTGVPGVITGVGGTPVPHPYVTPVLPPGQTPPSTSAPLPKNECIYKGQAYHQGQKWQDGCDYNCECIDGKMGKYQCTQRCSTFPVIPSQCQMQRDPNDFCCFVPLCNFNQTAPTPGPQVSPSPGSVNIPSTAFCVYNGLAFKQGQVWDQGCSKQCRCDNALTNYYSCFDRCPSFSNLDPSCIMKTNPSDPCCQIPECLNSPTPAPNMQPTLVPGATPTPNPYPVPTLPPGKITGSGPQVNPNTGLPQVVGFCEYKGKQYHKGDSWDDGCNYKCKCIEETTGTFTCNERCPRFAKLPANCFMATDPNDRCCKIPSCPPTPAPGLSPTAAPGYTLPTQSPFASPTPVPQSKDVCIYQGHPYTQGQKWFDGCDKKCMCENAKIGYYTCTDRCPSYTNLTPTCVMVPDPNDPDCCTAPQCDNTNTTNPTGVYGSIVGNGRPPTPAPFLAPTLAPGASPDPNAPSPTPMPKVCVYKGTQYTQGQKWQDGCSYKCECMNADAGRFICTDRCARYPNLPLSCRLEFDPMDPCCEKPNCTPNAAPTLRPGQTTPNPNDFCVYNGIPYKQGQSWQVGCEKVCRCDDAKIGRVNCDDRCPSFPVLTGTCSLVTDPNDACCQVPKCVNNNTTNPDQVIIGVPGTITNGGHGMAPNPNSGTRNGCVYKGQYYTQGQQWDDGCTYHCSCEDGTAGLYRCTEKCPRYARIPSYCTMVQDPANQCCEKPYCTPNKTPAPQPSLAPGQTPPSVSPLAPPQLSNNGCTYNGQKFQQGQLWYDGCSKICLCENGRTNFVRCQDRCAKFNTIGAGCTMVPDSRDPTCCKVPSCPLATPSVAPTPGIYTPNPSPPGVVNGFGKVPTPAPQPTPVPQPGVSTIAPVNLTPVPGCLYKGQVYGKGIKWDDDCNYKCECLDSMTGRYQCSQRCQRFDNIPKDKCVLIEDPNDKCCQVPYCDFLNPTPFPNGVPTPRPIMAPSAQPGVSPTPRPNIQPTLGPNGATPPNPFLAPVYYPTKSPSMTPAPNGQTPGLIPQQRGFCEYKGVYYTQGQTWTDGCQKICRCEAPEKGYFQCSSRCPRYNNLTSSCVLKTNPADPCCLAPDCNQYPTPRPDLPPVPGASPTTPLPIYVPSAVTGSFIGSAQNPNGITGGGINYCVYKGKVYSQGMTWDDGCNYKCTCEDASRGLYRCNDRCPQYYQLPWQCHYEKDPKDSCCQTAKCDFNLSPTPAPSTPAPITMAPTPHGWTGPTVKPLDVCMYLDNTTYSKGQTWDVGCDFRCVCEDPTQNKYNCNARCQVFASLPSVCTLIPDPSDKCCEVPSCGAYQPVTVINGTATPPPNSLNVLPVGTHNLIAGSSWGPGSGTHPVTGQRDKCIYKGQAYSQGQSWNDGCQFVCSCEDANKGIYRCLSKCPAYPQIPNYCHKVTVPGQCCPSLSCDVPGYGNYNPVPQLVPVVAPTLQPGVSPTPRPSGLPPVIHVIPSTSQGNTTGGLAPLPGGGYPITNNQVSGVTNQCIYKNKLYNQGQTWDDDCDYTCNCIDGRTGYYECTPKCPAYPDLPATCFLIKSSGNCCRTPQCTYYGMVLDPVAHPEIGIPVVGQYSGGFTGFKPGINFTQTFPTGVRDVCVYKGKIYHQNDKWDDGCDYSCICDDSSTGHYQCSTKCPTFAKLPSYCSKVAQTGSCCMKVQCDPGLLQISTTTPVTLTPTPYPPTPTPDPNSHCVDTINNCNTYGQASCSKYSSWAKRNCPFYCGMCTGTGVGGSTVTPGCMDNLPNCHEFGYSHCTGIYSVWAKDNCADYCGLCPGATHYPTTTATTTTGIPCVDVLPNCQDFVAANFCQDPAYGNWSLTNCAKTCGLCAGGAQGPTSTVGSMTTGNGWLLLMKGVAGVPGDLYQLWSGQNTLNPNVPEAQYLTAQYPGHYKPDLSNNWGSLCLDRVKVSIYNKGVEKAWIVFNATGANKMNWFTKDRIVDSSWSDIKTAASQFSMPGDPTVGRQFYASGNSNGCDSTGWMMISTTTTNPCFFESGSKPAFYYAPGQTQARWGFTKGTGDVFAIQGHSTCPTTLVVPTNSGSTNGCMYKGKNYKAGDNWVDDCKYNCTCDSDVTGHYTCNDLCPIYTNLPSSLKLEKVPGQCCPKVVFIFTGTIISFTAPPNMCFYKGNSYGTGETWDDGCDYKCNCLDAATGRYKCTQKCVTWNLPPICHLNEPAKGKCCKTPNCPYYVTINYPPNYQEE